MAKTSNNDMKRIAVLMTCYNRVETTLECLMRLFSQNIPDIYTFDVWLVDDASPDGTGAKVKASYPKVNVIQGSGGLFWCKGMRLAWMTAAQFYDYDFYLWLNDDVILKDGALSSLLEDYDEVGGVIVGTFAPDSLYATVSYGATRKMPSGRACVADKQMSGNLVLVPREVYRKVGAICGRYHHQYGDYDYGFLLLKNGLSFYASSMFSGVCRPQPERYSRYQKNTPICARLKLLVDPKGYDLHDAFLYKYRSKGLLRALGTVLHVTFRVVWGR